MRACPLIAFPVYFPFCRLRCAARSGLLRIAGPVMTLLAIIFLAGALSRAIAAPSAELTQHDASERAAYLYNFLSYIEWPSRAFALVETPLVIGVINAETVAAELLLSTVGRNVNNRPVAIRRLHSAENLEGVHLLYIGPGEAEQVESVIRQVPQRWTVTVTDEQPSGVISFRHVEGRLRFEVSTTGAERGDFKLSSRLMSVAIVQPVLN